jgi:hypothetical protein
MLLSPVSVSVASLKLHINGSNRHCTAPSKDDRAPSPPLHFRTTGAQSVRVLEVTERFVFPFLDLQVGGKLSSLDPFVRF